MKSNTRFVGIVLFIVLALGGCTQQDDFPVLKGPYLGQSPPGSEPQLFMPGLISTNYIDHCIGFLREGRVCVFSIWEKGTYYLYEKDGCWTQPEEVPWQNEQGTTDFTAAPDGNTVYFQSRRLTSPDDSERETNIWKVEWTGDGWTEPVPLPSPANTEEYSEAYPSVTPEGSVYYFTGSRPDSGIGDIYRSKLVGGKYLEAERLPVPINSDYYEVDPFVAPDGSYLLFGSDRPGGYGLMDLYISFRGEDGRWAHTVNTGPGLNPFCIPTRMSVTPDGKYFFFPSRHETEVPKGEEVVSSNINKWGDYDIYWMGTGFINDLRDRYMGKKSAAGKIVLEYREQGINSAAAMLSELYSNKQDSFYFELSEFMLFCGDLITAGKGEESEQIYTALLASIPEEFRIKQGYALACILNGQASKGLDLMKEMWAQFPSAKSEEMHIITFQLRRTSNREDELAVLRFITLEFPDSGSAHFYLAEAHEHYGNLKEAVKHCTKALELNPGFEDAVEMRKRLASKIKSPGVSKDDFPLLKGPYLGQTPPGTEPEIFAPGIITTHYSQSYIAFLNEARVCVYSAGTDKGHETYYTYEKNGFWTTPERAPFEELQGHPNYTTGPLGRKVYFHSGRPTHPDDTRQDDNIWTIEWTGSGWAEPEALLAPANSDYGEAYPSAAADGSVYFFTWRRPGTRGDDIWVSRCVNGQYQEAERLPWPINTDFIEYDPYVAPDESFLIFGSTRPGGYGNSDNYICFRKEDGSWTSPINLGRPLNSSSWDLCANGTPDGRYFFFISGRKTDVDKGQIGKTVGEEPEEDSDLYWVDFSFTNDLKNTLLTQQNAAEIIKQDYRENGIQSAVETLKKLDSNQKDATYFPPFELLALCKDMMAGEKNKDADLFASALAAVLPEDFSIKEAYASLCAMNGHVSKTLKIFEELESEDPGFDLNDTLSGLGYLFTLYPDKTEDALSVLKFTVKKFPEDPWAYYSLARVYRQLGDLDKAIANCRKALEIRPSVGDISQLLERLLQEQKKKK